MNPSGPLRVGLSRYRRHKLSLDGGTPGIEYPRLDHHPEAKFIFAGDGDMLDGLERRAVGLRVAPATRFVGHCSGLDVVSLFKSTDVVCVPSRNSRFHDTKG